MDMKDYDYQKAPDQQQEQKDLIQFGDYLQGMNKVVEEYMGEKAEMDKFKQEEDENPGIRAVQADQFEIINNRKRIVHTQPFTDNEIKDAFFTFDMTGNGFVAAAEIRFVLDALGENVTDEEIDEMVRMIDLDGDGQVNFKEFQRMASGDSLAPLGTALPPPRDMK